jgi:two-component system repressor protein LuxO
VCASPEEARAALRAAPETIVIADLDTIGGPGRLAEMGHATSPLIATSASASLTTAVAAMKSGATDFMAKPIGARALIERLDAAVAGWSAPASSERAAPLPPADFAGFIGRSAAMVAVYGEIRRMAPSRAPVFLTGESGTGKELAAEAIHQFAGAGGRPFIAINCSAIPRDLMESEIFGHVRGAFTGAAGDRAGAAELADGGTLFLDEVAEMDLGLQAKLLRFLQTGTFRRVGGSDQSEVDVRIISATNRDPFAEVGAGRLRADLFYRLHVLPIHLPALRERRDDIALLAEAFLQRFVIEESRAFSGFDEDALAVLAGNPWPGNVRQLASVVRRVVVLNEGPTASLSMLPELIRSMTTEAGPEASDPSPQGAFPAVQPYWRQEQTIIEAALAAFGGNIARAAAALEISPSTIYRKRRPLPGGRAG